MRWLVLALLAAAVGAAPGRSAGQSSIDRCPTNPVLRWNEAALLAVRADKTPPPVAARNLAVLHVAVHDAVAATVATDAPFRVRYVERVDADPAAAAAVAAHRVLVELYPARVAEFDAALDASLEAVPEGPARRRGVALGQAAAEGILRWRAADNVVARRSDYRPREGPGLWRPTPSGYRPPLLPGWGRVPGFAVADITAFRPPAPPAVGTPEYERAAAEVAALGRADSRVRTPEQTDVAHFWADGEGTVTPPGHWNRIAQTVAADRHLTVVEAARLFAVLNAAMADAAVVCWDCKYHFDVWRPVTALRESDPGWSPLLPTPPFPAYTSGHSSFSGSAAAALAAFFGTDEVAFATTSDGLPGATRSFRRFSSAAEEAGMSRIYGGIHWQFDNAAGLRCGREIGAEVAKRFGLPARPQAGTSLRPPVVEELRQRR